MKHSLALIFYFLYSFFEHICYCFSLHGLDKMQGLCMQDIYSSLSEYFDMGQLKEVATSYSLDIISALIIIILGSLIVRVMAFIISRLMQGYGLEHSINTFITKVFTVFMRIVVYVAAISALGVDVTSIIAALGAAGFAVGLAMKNMLSNFASGIAIIVLKYFKRGDRTEIAGVKGTVEEVGIFNSILKTEGGETVIIPNGKITSDKVIIHSD